MGERQILPFPAMSWAGVNGLIQEPSGCGWGPIGTGVTWSTTGFWIYFRLGLPAIIWQTALAVMLNIAPISQYFIFGLRARMRRIEARSSADMGTFRGMLAPCKSAALNFLDGEQYCS
jgi:hypothetical protein